MKSRFLNPMMAALGGATLLAGLALPAHADLVFKMANQSNVEAKGVVQNTGIVYLKRGQVEDVRAKGNWTVKSCFAGLCPAQLNSEYTVNFEHLQNAGHQYCVWKVTRVINEGAGSAWGWVQLTAKLIQSDPAYVCEVGGQTQAKYHSSSQGIGATMNFTVRNK
jgi:hypothetical protein